MRNGPSVFESAGQAIRRTRDDLTAAHREYVYAQHVRHICALCGETRVGRFGDTLAWFKEHTRSCQRRRR